MILDELEQRVIRQAQRELAPAPAVREQSELMLLARLAGDLPVGTDASGLRAAGAGRRPAARTPWFALTGLPGRMLGVGLALGALVGGWVGYSLGQRSAGHGDAGPVARTFEAPPRERAEVPAEAARASEDVVAAPVAPAAPSPTAPSPAASLAASAATELGSPAAGRPPRRAVPAAPRGGASSLAEELAMLQRARRALGGGNAPLALGIVQELDERFPKGVLLEERIATRVFSLCQLERVAEAREVAREFLARHPSSVYAERVRTSCIETPE